MRRALIVGATTAVLAACASAPQRSEQLEQARAEIETLSQDPLAGSAASQDLEAARDHLHQAQTALQQKRPMNEVDHLAYLAKRNAQTGEARVAQAHARQDVAQGEEERNRVLLESRTREAQNAKTQAQEAQSQLANAQQQLADLQAKQTDRGVVVTLGDVLFDTGLATLKPGADLALDRLAVFLKQNPQTRVVIEGHTDSRGSAQYNEQLSQRRADAVARALTMRNVPADRYEAVGRGKDFPVASNDTAAGRQQNRRVEIVFSDASGHFAQGEMQRGPVAR
ncbi:MAG TPA: OmpA family protein [Steroidobacteraceae bacterium]|nr:OmpA family protein [Steroidobacteraceae bacterium]